MTVGFLDILLRELVNFPKETFLSALLKRSVTPNHLVIPAIGLIVSVLLMAILFTKWWLPWYAKKYRKNVNRLVTIDTAYREHNWSLAKENVLNLLRKMRFGGIFTSHHKNLENIGRFIHQDLQNYFETIR